MILVYIFYNQLRMPDEQLFFSLHYYTLDSSDNPLIFINLCLTILPSATYSLPIQCDGHKGQVCVSSSVPKSDSQHGFEAIQHSRGPRTYDCLSWQRRPDSIGVKTYLHFLNCCQSCLISLVWYLLVHAVKQYLLPTQQFSVTSHA